MLANGDRDVHEPASCSLDVARGELRGASGRYRKTLAQLAGLYEDRDAFERALAARGDEPVYDVTDFRPSASAGDAIAGVTRMRPGKIGDEYFLTRGHIHAVADRAEIYHGRAGDGVVLLESPGGDIRALALRADDVVYVPPYWIHRTVNVGADDLVFLFVYAADAGQDYGIIERSHGMRSRVVDDGRGGRTLRDNSRYVPRTAAEIAALRVR